jgi:hypothetical protein
LTPGKCALAAGGQATCGIEQAIYWRQSGEVEAAR